MNRIYIRIIFGIVLYFGIVYGTEWVPNSLTTTTTGYSIPTFVPQFKNPTTANIVPPTITTISTGVSTFINNNPVSSTTTAFSTGIGSTIPPQQTNTPIQNPTTSSTTTSSPTIPLPTQLPQIPKLTQPPIDLAPSLIPETIIPLPTSQPTLPTLRTIPTIPPIPTISEIPTIPPEQIFIDDPPCFGFKCPNGRCVLIESLCEFETNGIIPRCPFDNPVRCSDGTCNISKALCDNTHQIECIDGPICANGQCAKEGVCPEYDGCSIDLPFQCPDGVCAESVSSCISCFDGHLKCFDGSCNSPCPFPPFYYKPINIRTVINEAYKYTQIPVNTYSSPLNITTELKKVVDIFIQPNTFPENTTFLVSSVSDSYVGQVENEINWYSDQTYQTLLLSPVINITAVDVNSQHLTNFDKKVRLDFQLLSSIDLNLINSNSLCLGFIDTNTNRWECIPDSVESITDGKVITYTDHFTSFALLLTQFDDQEKQQTSGGADALTFNQKKMNFKMTIGIVVGCISFVVLIVVGLTLWHYSSKHKGLRNWLIASQSNSSLQFKRTSVTLTSPSSSPPHKTLSRKDLSVCEEEIIEDCTESI